MGRGKLLRGDALARLAELPENSIDALVTDPPAGISFMGKEWDSDRGGRDKWIEWLASVMREAHRVMKPGAHGLVWALPRTSHWTGMALERAGFEVRDCITHLFGTGFPKSLDVSKAIDKAAGAKREVIGSKLGQPGYSLAENKPDRMRYGQYTDAENECSVTAPTTDAAKQWDGWGTALKPAAEFFWLIRKPLSEKTVAANVLKWGTGAINVDGCRVEGAPRTTHKDGNKITNSQGMFTMGDSGFIPKTPTGRFPANLVLSHDPECTDTQCTLYCAVKGLDEASRFFYCSKVSPSERNAGLEGMPDKELATSTGQTRPNSPARLGANPEGRSIVKNNHPTVKPIKLMRYLARLITPPGGTVLDPFMGSGSTGCAALQEGFGFIGIEQDAEFFEIAKKRITHALAQKQKSE